jgi:hypothetical protein
MGFTSEQNTWLKKLGVKFPPDLDTDGAEASSPEKHSLTADENSALSKMDSATLSKQDLTQRDTKEIFTENYMDGLVGLKIAGANDKRLKEIMRKLAKGVTPGERQTLIVELSKIRGVDADELNLQYDRFMIIRSQQEAIRDEKHEDVVPDLAEDIHSKMMASNPQLVFGKVIGDTFGIDPVFGALLSPTGGDGWPRQQFNYVGAGHDSSHSNG